MTICYIVVCYVVGNRLRDPFPNLAQHIYQRSTQQQVVTHLVNTLDLPGLVDYMRGNEWDSVHAVDILKRVIDVDTDFAAQLALTFFDEAEAFFSEIAHRHHHNIPFDLATPRHRLLNLLVCSVADVFLSADLLIEGSTFLLRALRDRDCVEDAWLQNRLLECNLLGNRKTFVQHLLESRYI